MTLSFNVWGVVAAVVNLLLDVAQFWRERWFSWWKSRSPKAQLLDTLANAETFEEWEDAAFQLDEILSTDLWRQDPTSKHYDYRLILSRLESIITARENEDILTLVNLLRSGLVRNLGNITTPKLFNHAYAGTKLLIDDYITQVALSIQYVTSLLTTPHHESGFTSQAKLELLHDTRQAFGRTSLVLQGGSVFGFCHLGIVKALHLRGLLPRIITGTATGALVAALVGVHSEDELLTFLDGDAIDLTPFHRQRSLDTDSFSAPGKDDGLLHDSVRGASLKTKLRRMNRVVNQGNVFDARVLEEVVRGNVGELTFEEAYAKTKRILNITVAASGNEGCPNLLNYLTAPNVLIWSAALASNMSSSVRHPNVTLLCKDETGAILPWPHAQDVTFRSWRQIDYTGHESPLARLAELFNVNHFIVSQARPYVVPFLLADTYRSDKRQNNQRSLTRPLMRLILLEIRHRLKQIDYLGFLPSNIRRLLIDESIPGPSITLIPNLSLRDLTKILENPTKQSLDYWILQGERGVWPAVSALKVRCAIEIELDKGYQIVRRRRPSDSQPTNNPPMNTATTVSTGDEAGSNITTAATASTPRHNANESAPRKRRMMSSDP